MRKIKGLKAEHFIELVKSSINKDYLDGQSLNSVFESEYGYSIKRIGEKQAASEYLAGLPSVCTVPFSNYEIIQWVQNIVKRELTEKEKDNLLESYFSSCGMAFVKLLYTKKV